MSTLSIDLYTRLQIVQALLDAQAMLDAEGESYSGHRIIILPEGQQLMMDVGEGRVRWYLASQETDLFDPNGVVIDVTGQVKENLDSHHDWTVTSAEEPDAEGLEPQVNEPVLGPDGPPVPKPLSPELTELAEKIRKKLE